MRKVQGIELVRRAEQAVDFNRLKAERDGTDHVEFLFRATIDVPDGGSFEKNWMITARKDSAAWKVSNFGEYE